jgi:uridine kinase
MKSEMDRMILEDKIAFTKALFEKMKMINPGISSLELYEFRYLMDNLAPAGGWENVTLEPLEKIEQQVNNINFYRHIQIKPRQGDQIVLDSEIVHLTNMLLVGLVTGDYPLEWVNANFYFDIRATIFLRRTTYFTGKVLTHLGGKPFRQFEARQKTFEDRQDVGYQEFMHANEEVDALFIDAARRLIDVRGTPILLAIAGPTAAGKTEIVERLHAAFRQAGRQTTSIEMDNFLTDRDDREAKGIFTQGKEALHFGLFTRSLADITAGRHISIPRYNFIDGTSSHDNEGNLKPGRTAVEIDPADIIFIEGNFPFLIQEVIHLIGIKVVYLTDDPVRLKRKWKRDIDYRKKYEPTYFRNRYFKDQFIMAEIAFRPQMEVCDMVVDTTGAALWLTPEIAKVLSK